MDSDIKEKLQRRLKLRQERREFITHIQDCLVDDTFVRKSRKIFWRRLALYSVFGIMLIFLSIFSYSYLATINHGIALGVSVSIFLLALYSLSQSRRCGACGGNVASTPAYCYDCGLTFWFHELGSKAYKERLRNIEKAVAKHIAKDREQDKAQYEFIDRVEEIMKTEDTNEQDKQFNGLSEEIANKAKH